MTLQLPALDDASDEPVAMEHPAVPASETLNEYSPKPEPPEAASAMLVLNVPDVDVKITAACVPFPIFTVVATELATK